MPKQFLSTLIATFLVAGCGSSVTSQPALVDSSASTAVVLRGNVIDAPVRGATVTAYRVQPGGVIGEGGDAVRSFPVPPPDFVAVSNPSGPSSGEFSLNLPDGGPVLLKAVGGSYLDPVSGETVQLGPTDALMAVVPDPGQSTVQITHWSTMAARLALSKARTGTPVRQAFEEANRDLARHFALENLLSPGSAEDQGDLRLVNGALGQLAHNLGAETPSLRHALARDLSDGRFDGREDGRSIPVALRPSAGLAQTTSTPTTPLSPTAGTSDLSAAITAYQSGVGASSGDSASPELQSSLQSSDGAVSAAPLAYTSPYTINFTQPLASLTSDFTVSPRDDVTLESSSPSFANWYVVSAYPQGELPWGPIAATYPAPTLPSGVDPVVWQRERVVAVGLKYLGYNYQHHHIPDWNPEPYNWPQWLPVMVGHNSAGIDCSDFSSWNYNYGLGLKLNTNVATQASITSIPTQNGSSIAVQTIGQVTSSSPTDYASLVGSLQTGDLLYIRGNSAGAPGTGVTHVIMWLGSIGQSPDGTPLILDAHDNTPIVSDSNGNVIPPGVHIRPFIEGSWYHRAFDHAHRIIE